MRVENSISIKILLKRIELSDSNILKVLRVARDAGIKRLYKVIISPMQLDDVAVILNKLYKDSNAK